MNGHDDITRALIEAKCDVKCVYIQGNTRFTVGDLAIAAKKSALEGFIQNQGDVFLPPSL